MDRAATLPHARWGLWGGDGALIYGQTGRVNHAHDLRTGLRQDVFDHFGRISVKISMKSAFLLFNRAATYNCNADPVGHAARVGGLRRGVLTGAVGRCRYREQTPTHAPPSEPASVPADSESVPSFSPLSALDTSVPDRDVTSEGGGFACMTAV